MRNILRIVILAGTGLGWLGTAALAQEAEVESISTDRPTVGQSPDVIPGGSFQIENGVDVSAQLQQYAVDGPESLLRVGLTNRVEGRFLASNAVYQSSSASTASSLQSADAALGAKVLLAGPNTLSPKSAILSLSFPTGGPSLTSGSYDPSLTLLWTQAIPRGYFINELAGATLSTLHGARRPVWEPSIAFGRSFSPKFTVFGEYAPTVLQDRSVVHVVDGGLLFAPVKLQQLDCRVAYLNDFQGIHTLISCGYSIRRDGWGRRVLGEHKLPRDN
jgi:hypothetical protein